VKLGSGTDQLRVCEDSLTLVVTEWHPRNTKRRHNSYTTITPPLLKLC
jgi:hypothetical protein